MRSPLPSGSVSAQRPFASVWMDWLEHSPSDMHASARPLPVDPSSTCPHSRANPGGTDAGHVARPVPVPAPPPDPVPGPGTTLRPSVGNASGSIVGCTFTTGAVVGFGCSTTGTTAGTAILTRPRLSGAVEWTGADGTAAVA